jgi:hypothetical protein
MYARGREVVLEPEKVAVEMVANPLTLHPSRDSSGIGEKVGRAYRSKTDDLAAAGQPEFLPTRRPRAKGEYPRSLGFRPPPSASPTQRAESDKP